MKFTVSVSDPWETKPFGGYDKDMEIPVNAVVTLVHGTWARKSKWTKSKSKLRFGLEKAIPDPKLILEFSWSGGNSTNAREKAAIRLCKHIQEQIEMHPHAEHFVVGHSHGGNVALKALEKGTLFDRVAVVCLSTPFFYIRPRFQGIASEMEQIAGGTLATLLLAPAALQWHYITDHKIVSIPLAALFFFCVWIIEKRWKKANDAFRSKVAIAVPCAASLLLIRTVGDEAAALMGAFQIITWLMAKIGIFYSSILWWIARTYVGVRLRIKKFADSIQWWIVGTAGFGFLTDRCLALYYKRSVFMELMDRTSAYIPQAAIDRWFNKTEPVAPLIALLIASPVFLLALGVILGGVLPMGFGALFGVLLNQVTVEPVPTGKWELHQIEPQGRIDGLMHSMSYENAEALSVLADWIRSRIGEEFLHGLS